MRLTLMLLPFVVLIAAWFMGSAVRLEANPQDKLLPGLSQMVAAIDRMAFTPDKRSGEYLLWADTLISLSRLLTGLAVSSLIGLVIGIAAGVFPMYRAALSPLLTVVSMIPPLAILPVLFIVFGLDELSKVMLIVIGITPMLARDLEQRAQEIPAELFIKAQTLGANSWTLVLRVVLPQLLSRLITSAPAAGLGMAVPDLRRGHLRHRRAGVPHFPGAALYGDGRDYSLCHLDHLAGMADGSGAAPAAQSLFPVGGRRPGMSFIDIKNIWQEYGDHVVLERINLQVKEGEFCSMVGASGCGKSTFCACCSVRKNRPVAPSCSTASRWRRSRTAAAAWSSSAIRCFRISTCWITSPSVWSCRRPRCWGACLAAESARPGNRPSGCWRKWAGARPG
jgi:ABC-type nitrate/sulfonate/bicarbonate transport system permease component